MVLPTNPNSKQGAIFLINLASEVPPVVESLGFIFVIFLIEKINFPSPEKKYEIDITNEIKKL